MVQPPRRVAPADIPPREYIFIMDVSGSMYGFPLDGPRRCCGRLIGSLRPQDYFNVLLFAGDSATLAPESLPATPENIEKALALIDSQRGGGGTELLPALQTALALPRAEKSAAQRGHRYRRLRGRGEGGLRPGPPEPRPGQPVRLRHRHQRQPLPDRGHGPRRPWASRSSSPAPEEAEASRGAVPRYIQHAGADPGQPVASTGSTPTTWSRAGARRARRAAGDRLRQVARRARGDIG